MSRSLRKTGCKSKSLRKKPRCWKNNFFPKRSSGLIESSFDKSFKVFLLNVRNWKNRSSNLRKNFLRMFFWSRIMQFRERSWKSLPFSERFCLKVWKTRFFFKKKHCSQNVLLGSSNVNSATLPKCSGQKSKKCLIQIRKTWKTNFSKKKSFFSQNDPQRS